MDVISEVLRSGRAGAALLSRFDYRGAWGIEIEGDASAGLHWVEAGRCWLRVEGAAPVELEQGDVALLPLGTRHVLSDAPDRPSEPLPSFLAREDAPENGGCSGGWNARVVCAAVKIDDGVRAEHPLMQALPALVHMRAAEIQRSPSLNPCFALLARELGEQAPGRAAVVELLLETVLVYVVRDWLESQHEIAASFVGALRDPRLSRALSAMHAEPAQRWTVATLAEVAGMSRPAFARRFKAHVGASPLDYLTHVRLGRAARILGETDAGLAEVAARVGYASEFAFSRAFKRRTGRAPSTVRTHGPQPMKSRALPVPSL